MRIKEPIIYHPRKTLLNKKIMRILQKSLMKNFYVKLLIKFNITNGLNRI